MSRRKVFIGRPKSPTPEHVEVRRSSAKNTVTPKVLDQPSHPDCQIRLTPSTT